MIHPPADLVRRHDERADAPFSSAELVECWARYWDVHTRNPLEIMEDEGLAPPLRKIPPFKGLPRSYSDEDIDFVMEHGRDCEIYAAPYRWLNQRTQREPALADTLFPLITHLAFLTAKPNLVFCAATEYALASSEVREIFGCRPRHAVLDWLFMTPSVRKYAAGPAIVKLGMNPIKVGLPTIHRGLLKDHPVYSAYPYKAEYMRLHTRHFVPEPRSDEPIYLELANQVHKCMDEDLETPFRIPGEPYYRHALGRYCPPPRIHFANLSWSAMRSDCLALTNESAEDPAEKTFAQVSDRLDARVARFRRAEKAASLGLPLDAFEGG